MILTGALLISSAGFLASCSSGGLDEAPISDECRSTVSQLSSILSTSEDVTIEEEELYAESLTTCKSIAEWSNAMSKDSMALGFTELSAEDAADMVYIDCYKNDPELKTPVCADAKAKKYLD